MNDAIRCFHCHNLIPSNIDITVKVDNESKAVCCHGCKAVAELVLEGGLQQFYQFREGELEQPENLAGQELDQLAVYDRPDILSRIASVTDTGHHRIQLSIEGITCAACVWLLEQYVKKLPGVTEFWVNLTTHRAELVWQQEKIPLSGIFKAIRTIGFGAHPYSTSEEEKRLQEHQKSTLIRLGVAGIGMMQNMMLAVPGYFGLEVDVLQQSSQEFVNLFRYVSLLVALPVVLYSAKPFFIAALRDLRLRHLTMDVPVSIAIGGAFIASVWITFKGGPEVYFDSVCMFTFFLLLGRYLESQARVTAARSQALLRNEAPAFIRRLNPKLGNEELIPIGDIEKGDHIRLRPGELIPADGTIIEGSSQVNNAALTGEFSPKACKAGDTLLSGSVNIDNPLVMEVAALGQDSHLSTINRLVDRALQERPRLSTLADRVASVFVASVLIIAAIVGLIWWQIDPQHAFAITLSVLVVTCPCALSLATPTALTVATTALRQSGFVLSRGHVLETLAKANRFVFDKTGTLTKGELTVTHVSNLKEVQELSKNTDKDETVSQDTNTTDVDHFQLLAIAGALEWESPHPIAKAFKPYATASAAGVQHVTGEGVSGTINGQHFRLGNARFCGIPEGLLPVAAENQQLVYLSRDDKLLAYFLLADTLRPGAAQAISGLNDQGIQTSILSGDNSNHVDAIAHELGIREFEKSLSPAQKLDRARSWQQAGDTLVMVGDGINDVPVMAGSHLSIAMQNASDLTQLNADAVILNGELNTLLFALKKARATLSVIRQNLGWALIYNLIALPLAAFGLVPPWAAAIGMSLSSLIVVFNALRLSGIRKP